MKVDAMGAVQRMDDIGNKLNPIDAGATWEETKNPEMPKPADTSTEALSGRANRSVEQLGKNLRRARNNRMNGGIALSR